MEAVEAIQSSSDKLKEHEQEIDWLKSEPEKARAQLPEVDPYDSNLCPCEGEKETRLA